MTLEKQIEDLANSFLGEGDVFLVNIVFTPSNELKIQLDGDKGVAIENCVALSRYLGNQIEEQNLIEQAYRLEVSSAGVGSPLLLHRQYVKNVGRTVEVKTKEAKLTGTLEQVNETFIAIKLPVTKKKEEAKEVQIPFEEIIETKVVITF